MAISADKYRASGRIFQFPIRSIEGVNQGSNYFEVLDMFGCNSIKVESVFIAGGNDMSTTVEIQGSLNGKNFASLPSGQGRGRFTHRDPSGDWSVPSVALLWYGRSIPFLRIKNTEKINDNPATLQVYCYFE